MVANQGPRQTLDELCKLACITRSHLVTVLFQTSLLPKPRKDLAEKKALGHRHLGAIRERMQHLFGGLHLATDSCGRWSTPQVVDWPAPDAVGWAGAPEVGPGARRILPGDQSVQDAKLINPRTT